VTARDTARDAQWLISICDDALLNLLGDEGQIGTEDHFAFEFASGPHCDVEASAEVDGFVQLSRAPPNVEISEILHRIAPVLALADS
jgi:hypothetical protein